MMEDKAIEVGMAYDVKGENAEGTVVPLRRSGEGWEVKVLTGANAGKTVIVNAADFQALIPNPVVGDSAGAGAVTRPGDGGLPSNPATDANVPGLSVADKTTPQL